ncbi:MAG: hypothetical protein ACQES4_00910 [Bacillota bacterium]
MSGKIITKGSEIKEIHVLANSARSPKQVVRDIESAVLIQKGLQLDHKKISVAQLESGNPLPVENGIRFLFRSITFKSESGRAEVIITIDVGNESYTAGVSGPNTRQNRLRMVASATIEAVEKSLGVKHILSVGDAQKMHLCGQNAIAVGVCLHSGGQEEILLGTAINKGDDLEATVRASLDAINRRMDVFTDN